MSKLNEKLFSGSLTFLSILIGVFTFTLVNSISSKGTLPDAYPWYTVTIVTGLSLILSSVVCISSFSSNNENNIYSFNIDFNY